jgi:two-component system chemotaxis sensor kinase CheA
MGDGKVAMILDPGGIAHKAGLRFADLDKESNIERDRAQKKTASLQEILLFDNNTTEQFGLNLNSITRIEHVSTTEIERVGSREFIKRDGHSVSLVRIHEFLPVQSPSEYQDDFFLILPRSVDNRIGIIASNVYDILHTELKIETRDIKGSGILGSTILNEKIVIMLNIEELISNASQRFEVTYG